MERQYLPNILQDWMFVSGAEDLQTICHGPQSSLVFMILNYSHHNPIFCLLTYWTKRDYMFFKNLCFTSSWICSFFKSKIISHLLSPLLKDKSLNMFPY